MFRRLISGTAVVVAIAGVLTFGSSPARAEDTAGLTPQQIDAVTEYPLKDSKFSFEGFFGTYDKATLQRGLYIYHEVCSNCHGLYELSYRNLSDLGYNDKQIKAYASQYQVTDGPNDNGDMFQRAALPSDKFIRPFANEKAARAANNGAYPPDLAMIVKAREGGVRYVYSILQGFKDPPPDVVVPDGLYYNMYFSRGAHMIAMPPPLQDATVTFPDGAPNDLADEAKDVATFLNWAADPHLNERHEMGIRVMLFLAVLSVLLYGVKRQIWADAH